LVTVGEIEFIDSIQNLQDGSRTRFPLFFNGQLLSFEKDLNNASSQLIDLNAVLLIFINGVLQEPGSSYTFEGGTTFEFDEAPRTEAKVDIFFINLLFGWKYMFFFHFFFKKCLFFDKVGI